MSYSPTAIFPSPDHEGWFIWVVVKNRNPIFPKETEFIIYRCYVYPPDLSANY